MTVSAEYEIVFSKGYAITLHDDNQFKDLIQPSGIEKTIIKEGQNPQDYKSQSIPGKIKTIQGAEIKSGDCLVRVMLDITVESDTKEIIKRNLELILPVSIEQLPGPNWLCIDFGTSAISVGKGSGQNIYNIPLQNITKNGDKSLAEY